MLLDSDGEFVQLAFTRILGHFPQFQRMNGSGVSSNEEKNVYGDCATREAIWQPFARQDRSKFISEKM